MGSNIDEHCDRCRAPQIFVFWDQSYGTNPFQFLSRRHQNIASQCHGAAASRSALPGNTPHRGGSRSFHRTSRTDRNNNSFRSRSAAWTRPLERRLPLFMREAACCQLRWVSGAATPIDGHFQLLGWNERSITRRSVHSGLCKNARTPFAIPDYDTGYGQCRRYNAHHRNKDSAG